MSRAVVLLLATFASYATAQTFSACNPRTNTSCPNDPALGTIYNETFSASTTALNPALWNISAGAQNIAFTDNGAELTIKESGDSVTVESAFYIFWGQVEIIMQAAAGQGIISTFDLLSDDLDEIDLEIMGGNTSFVESNWYGWGNTSQYNAIYHPCQGPQETMHNYTFAWGPDELQWIIDGNSVRTLKSDVASKYPQTPSMLKFGIWAGGDKSQPNGTIEWAGGLTDWSKGPFTMTIHSIKITDGHTNVSSYVWGDNTGNAASIQALPGESPAYSILNKQSTFESAQTKWNGLSTTAKIAIGAGVGGLILVVVVAYTIICVVQRKKGRAEKAAADKEWDAHTAELMEYRTKMAKGDFAVSHMGHGEKF